MRENGKLDNTSNSGKMEFFGKVLLNFFFVDGFWKVLSINCLVFRTFLFENCERKCSFFTLSYFRGRSISVDLLL